MSTSSSKRPSRVVRSRWRSSATCWPRASLPGEIVCDGDFYGFEEKYRTPTTKLLIPAPLSDSEVAEAQELALTTFKALRAEGMARVDLFYSDEGQFLVNEVNTIPGFTPISMYPMLWEASGLPLRRSD